MTRKSEPVALFDLDGTLADFDGSMRRELVKLASPHEDPADITGKSWWMTGPIISSDGWNGDHVVSLLQSHNPGMRVLKRSILVG